MHRMSWQEELDVLLSSYISGGAGAQLGGVDNEFFNHFTLRFRHGVMEQKFRSYVSQSKGIIFGLWK